MNSMRKSHKEGPRKPGTSMLQGGKCLYVSRFGLMSGARVCTFAEIFLLSVGSPPLWILGQPFSNYPLLLGLTYILGKMFLLAVSSPAWVLSKEPHALLLRMIAREASEPWLGKSFFKLTNFTA